jgi:hypothetical protein
LPVCNGIVGLTYLSDRSDSKRPVVAQDNPGFLIGPHGRLLSFGVMAGFFFSSFRSKHINKKLLPNQRTEECSGRQLIYRAEYARMNAVLAYLTENCRQGEVCLDEAAARCHC